MAKMLLVAFAAPFAVGWIGVQAWIAWEWLHEEPLTAEELERADMRSCSWPYDEGGAF